MCGSNWPTHSPVIIFTARAWLSGGRVWFWTGDDAASAHAVTVPANARDLTLHPDGTRLAVAGANGSALVYTLTPAAPAKK